MRTSLSNTSTPLVDGFEFLTGILSEQEIAAARHGQVELISGRADIGPVFDWPTPRSRRSRSWKTPYATHFRSELAALARSPVLLERIAQATAAESLRLWFDQLLWEEPAIRSSPDHSHWHTERSRWKTCQARLMVTAWIPLAHIEPEMGPITLVRESARRRWLELPDGWEPEGGDLVPATVQPGDAALFCWHTVHGNPPNLGSSPRRAIALHYAVDDLRYRRYGKFSHLNERVVGRVGGSPDFHDQRVIPQVWAAHS